MMKRILVHLVLMSSLAGSAVANTGPASAAELVSAAQAKAKATNRAVMIGFTASWCGWCHKMAGVLKQAEIAAIMDKHFVIQWLVAMENPDKKNLENAGAEALMEKAGGKNSGIPFFYFTDASGKILATSMRPAGGPDKGGNVGCPYEANEIAWFMEMLKRGAPKLTSDDAKKIQTAFEALKKKDKGGA